MKRRRSISTENNNVKRIKLGASDDNDAIPKDADDDEIEMRLLTYDDTAAKSKGYSSHEEDESDEISDGVEVDMDEVDDFIDKTEAATKNLIMKKQSAKLQKV